jgi:hypothetical protein
MIQMMCAYIKLLMMLFWSSCKHVAHVATIFFIVRDGMAMFEHMTRNEVVHLLWAIFANARTYFSANTT